MSKTESNVDQNGGSVSIFQPISHMVLKSVEPVQVARFLRARERYELKIDEKSKEVRGLTKASFKVSVDTGLLKRMHFLGKLESFAPNVTFANLTSNQIEQWARSLFDRPESTFDPVLIEKTLKGLRMPMQIMDPES